MDYIALYRKYRPQTFDDVIGQENITDILKHQIENNQVGHAYLFCGGRGTGKTSTAKIFARAVNCTAHKEGEPCNTCDICNGILSSSIVDVSTDEEPVTVTLNDTPTVSTPFAVPVTFTV